jgi:hypothetical protein
VRILVGCEESGAVRDSFAARGHDAMSCDLLPTRKHGQHYQGSVFDVIDYPWDVGIFHPPCTHTSVSGAKHFAAKRMDGRQQFGIAFIMQIVRRSDHIRGVAIEQPVSILSTMWRKPDQVIQPWMFGHYETKSTCLWLRGLPALVPTYRSADECREAIGLPHGTQLADRIHKMPPSEHRARDRSETYAGIARAMAEQWGVQEPKSPATRLGDQSAPGMSLREWHA